MAGADEVRVTYIGVITDLTAKLKSIPGITASEARKAVKELGDLQKAQIAAAKGSKTVGDAAGASIGAIRAGQVNLLNQASDVLSQLSTGTNPLTILVQQGPQVVGALDMMGVGLGTVGAAAAAAAPLLLTLGGLGAVYYRLSGDIERAAEVSATYRDVNLSLVPTIHAIEDAEIKRDIAMGRISKTMGEIGAAQLAAERNVRSYAAGQRESLDAITQSTEAARKWVKIIGGAQTPLAALAGGLADSVMGWSDQVATGEERIAALNGGLLDEVEAQRKLRTIVTETAGAEGAAAQAKQNAKDAAREAAAAAREQARALNDVLDAMKAESGMELDRVVKIREGRERAQAATAAANVAALSGEAKAAAARDAAIAGINKEEAALLLLAKTKQEMGLIDGDFAAERVAVEAQAAAEIAKIREKEAADAKKAADDKTKAQIAAVDKAVSAATRIADGAAKAAEAAYDHQADVANKLREQLVSGDEYYTNAQKKQIAKRIRQHEAAARRAWQIEHGVALASATTNMLVAIGKAASSAPWPLNLIPMAGAAAETVPLVASVASQKPAFHSGYAPDEMDAKILRREAVVTPQGISTLGGSGAIRDANAGVPPGGPSVILSTTVYKHGAQTTRIKADGLRRRDPIAKMILASADTPYWRRKV